MAVHSDLTGAQFDRLTVIGYAGKDSGRNTRWRCRCTCGQEIVAKRPHLMAGRTRSCGCLHDEMVVRRNKSRAIHGLGHSSEYGTWLKMLARCTDPSSSAFANYGGRGITVCDRWHDFQAFYADMGPKPTPAHTLERKDNERGYSLDNCCWATRQRQNRNRRDTVRLCHNGEVLSLPDWADRVGISRSALYQRIRAGWSIDRALTAPARSLS